MSWQVVAVAYFNVLFQYSPGGSKISHEISHSEQPVS
jgi:hypothetical protein